MTRLAHFARMLGIIVSAALLATGALPDRASATTEAAQTVSGFYQVLLATMQNGPTLGPRGRYDELGPVVLRTFDIPYMTRMAVGSAWASLPEGKRREVADAFGRYVAATWADRFDSYSGEKLEVTGERPYGPAMLVETRIVKSNGEPVSINYLMRRNGDGGAWRIADVYLTGTISELATRRSEFSSILRDGGIDGLITALNRKAGNMVSAEAG